MGARTVVWTRQKQFTNIWRRICSNTQQHHDPSHADPLKRVSICGGRRPYSQHNTTHGKYFFDGHNISANQFPLVTLPQSEARLILDTVLALSIEKMIARIMPLKIVIITSRLVLVSGHLSK